MGRSSALAASLVRRVTRLVIAGALVAPALLAVEPAAARPVVPEAVEVTQARALPASEDVASKVPAVPTVVPDVESRRALGLIGTPSLVTTTFTIIGFGDSYGSGEGAPDQPRTWNDNDVCHRSFNAPLALAVGLLRNTFAGVVDIQYKNFACSGGSMRAATDAKLPATLDASVDGGGILTRYAGMPPENEGKAARPPQIEQANTWLAGRTADAALVNIGGNDAGFGRMLFLCAVLGYLTLGLGGDCADGSPGNVSGDFWSSMVLDAFNGPTGVSAAGREALAVGLLADHDVRCTSLNGADASANVCTPYVKASYNLLAQSLQRTARLPDGSVTKPSTWVACSLFESGAAAANAGLDAAIGTKITFSNGTTCWQLGGGLFGWAKVARQYPMLDRAVGKVYINTYPERATTDSDGYYCHFPNSDDLTEELEDIESELITTKLMPRLNGTIYGAANAHGWTVIDVGDGEKHGICSSSRWFNNNNDAKNITSAAVGLPGLSIYSGWAHPNRDGYKNMYEFQIADKIRLQICQKANIASCPKPTWGEPPLLPRTVSGTITGKGSPLVGMTVQLQDPWGNLLFQTTTDGSGKYRFPDIAPKTEARVQVVPPATGPLSVYLPEYSPSTFIVNGDKVQDLALTPGATVAGTVTSEAGTPLSGILVQAWTYADVTPTAVRTASDGTYRFAALPGNGYQYRFRFSTEASAPVHYRSRWHQQGTNFSTATVVTPAADSTTTLPTMTMTEGPDVGRISIYITDEDGYGADGVQVSAYDDSGRLVAKGETDEGGYGEIEDVPVGYVRLYVVEGPNSDFGYYGLQPRWYPTATGFRTAQRVEIVAEQTTQISYMKMMDGSRISVDVYDDDTGDKVPSIVRLYDTLGSVWTRRTDSEGEVMFTGLPAGEYTVNLEPKSPFINVWYEEAEVATSATTISIYGRRQSQHYYVPVRKRPPEVEIDVNRRRNNTVKIQWDPVFGAANYLVQRWSPSTDRWKIVFEGNALSYTDNGAANSPYNEEACYRVRAESAAYRSGRFGSQRCVEGWDS